jgi:hypothetical protein
LKWPQVVHFEVAGDIHRHKLGLQQLRSDIAAFTNTEDINHEATTHPAARLANAVPGYEFLTASNAAANASLLDLIAKLGWSHFPVTGGTADFSPLEPGFGIIAELSDGIAQARVLKQDALFFVQRGHVFLYEASSHARGPCWGFKSWAEMTEGPTAQPNFYFSGPPELLHLIRKPLPSLRARAPPAPPPSPGSQTPF